jgi:ketosteroid isomerase-like protein
MYSWLVGRMVRTGWDRLNERDVGAVPYAAGARFRFPGDSPLAVECRSREEIERWFDRLFERVPDLRFRVEDVVVSGPPWNLRVCTRYTASGDALGYSAAQFARIRWGRVTEELLFPDTEAIARQLR